jgi:membrane protein DedA with SNARE-associated domain
MEDIIFELLKSYTYEPLFVYILVFLVMFLSSLGLPVPEEFSIISLGVLSYMGAHPELFPPPYTGAHSVEILPSILVCSGSIFFSDFVVFSIGRRYGSVIFKSNWFARLVKEDKLDRVKAWARRWGNIVPGLFRLIPGVRFPGHLICGALGIKTSTFIFVDAFVISLIVPTQIYFIARYGEVVVDVLKSFQPIIVGICLLVLSGLFLNLYKLFKGEKT